MPSGRYLQPQPTTSDWTDGCTSSHCMSQVEQSIRPKHGAESQTSAPLESLGNWPASISCLNHGLVEVRARSSRVLSRAILCNVLPMTISTPASGKRCESSYQRPPVTTTPVMRRVEGRFPIAAKSSTTAARQVEVTLGSYE